MKPPKPKPLKPTTRWAIVDAEGEPLWIAQPKENTRRETRNKLGLFYHPSVGDRIVRVLITEVK